MFKMQLLVPRMFKACSVETHATDSLHRYFDREFFQRQEQFEDFEVSRRCISLLDGTYGKGVAGNMKRKGKTTPVVVTSCNVEDIQVIKPFLLRAHLGCTLQHPNILQTVGVVTNRLPLLVASQW